MSFCRTLLPDLTGRSSRAPQTVQHSIFSRKYRGNCVARPQIQQSTRLFHAIGSHADTQISQQARSTDGNRRGPGVCPDNGACDQVFNWRGLARISFQCNSLPGLCGKRQEQHYQQAATRHCGEYTPARRRGEHWRHWWTGSRGERAATALRRKRKEDSGETERYENQRRAARH